MKISYDQDVDAAYISFKGKHMPATTVRLTEDISVDFGPGEELSGIEILDASEHMSLGEQRKVQLENLLPT